MTVGAAVPPVFYNGDGVLTQFVIPWTVRNTLWVEAGWVAAGVWVPRVNGTHYTVAFSSGSWRLTFTTPPPVGVNNVVIRRVTPGQQTVALKDLRRFPAENVEAMGDLLAEAAQDLGTQLGAVFRLNPADFNRLRVLDPLTEAVGKFFTFAADPDSPGNFKVVFTPSVAAVEGVFAIAAQVVTVASISASVVAVAQAGVSAAIVTLAPQASNISALGPVAAQIGVLGTAPNPANMATLAPAVGVITTVATNIASVNSLAGQIASPTSNFNLIGDDLALGAGSFILNSLTRSTEAAASALLSQRFATHPEDTSIPGQAAGTFSGLHYRAKNAVHEAEALTHRIAAELAAVAAAAAAPPSYANLTAAIAGGLGVGDSYFNTTSVQFRVITAAPPDEPDEDVLRTLTGAQSAILQEIVDGDVPASIAANQAQGEAGADNTKAMTSLRVAQFDAIRRDTLSAKVYGAVGDNVAIENVALASMFAAVTLGFGGPAYLNLGTYKVDGASAPIVLKEATALSGAGPSASRINALSMTAGSVISHTPDGGSGNSSFIGVERLLIKDAFDSAVDFVGMDHSVIDWNFIDATPPGRTVRGLRLRDTFMMDVANNHIRETSGPGIDIDNVSVAVSTSLLLRLNHLKTTGGYRIRRACYLTDLNSGCDDSNSYSRDLANVNQMTFISPGAERSQKAMFNFEASTALATGVNGAVQDVRATIIAPVALDTGQSLAEPGFIRAVSTDSREIKVTVLGGYYRRPAGNAAAAVSLSGANVKVALIGSSLDATVAPSVTGGAALYELDWRTGAFHLEVTGGGASNAVLELNNKDDASNSGMLLKTGYSNASARNWGVFINRHVNGDFCIVQSTTLGGDPSTGGNGLTHLLLHNGRVAIGKTTAPTVALDVVGDGAISAALTVGTTLGVTGLTTLTGGASPFSIPSSANNTAGITLASTTDVTNHGLHITSGHSNASVRNWGITTNGSGFGRLDFRVGNSNGDSAMVGASSTARFSLTSAGALLNGGTQILSTRITGWAAATGTATRTTFVTSTVTLEQLAQRVKGLIDDCITHGLIGA